MIDPLGAPDSGDSGAPDSGGPEASAPAGSASKAPNPAVVDVSSSVTPSRGNYSLTMPKQAATSLTPAAAPAPVESTGDINLMLIQVLFCSKGFRV